METVLRAASVYLFVFVVMRLAGKRTLSQITTFDFVLLLIDKWDVLRTRS